MIGRCSKLDRMRDDGDPNESSKKISQPIYNCPNPNIQPRTDEQKKTTLATTTTSRNGESLCWYNFGKWSHPYYQKSSEQSSQEMALLDLTPTWNMLPKSPAINLGKPKPIYRGPPRHQPIGAGYKALWELDRIQPRTRYSRHTMPDPQTASLLQIQNPLERDQPLPCLRDQRMLRHKCINDFSTEPEFLSQKAAYEDQAMRHAHHFQKPDEVKEASYAAVPCSLSASCNHSAFLPKEWLVSLPSVDSTSIDQSTTRTSEENGYTLHDMDGEGQPDMCENERKPDSDQSQNKWINDKDVLPPALNYREEQLTEHQCDGYAQQLGHQSSKLKNSKRNTRSVTWADQQSINNNANDGNDVVKVINPLPRAGFKIRDIGELSQSHCDRYRSIKGGRYRHYLNTNSAKYETDLVTDYETQEDRVEYNMIDGR